MSTASLEHLAAAKGFRAFYPLYLQEHQNLACRSLHFLGSSLALGCLIVALLQTQPLFLLLGLFLGYFCAWVDHFGFEKTRPASFKRPLYSFMGDWVMYADILRRRIPF